MELNFKLGVMNFRVNHKKPWRLARRVRRQIKRRNIDVLVGNEFQPRYHKAFTRELRKIGMEISHLKGSPARMNSVLIHPNNWDLKAKASRKTSRGWIRARRNRHRGFHDGRVTPLFNLKDIRWAVVHGPPRPHRRWGQWRSRFLAKQDFYSNLGDILDQWNHKGRHWIAAGDFNVRMWSPSMRRFANKHKAIRRGYKIDGALLSRGISVSRIRKFRIRRWFDHPLITMRVKVKS